MTEERERARQGEEEGEKKKKREKVAEFRGVNDELLFIK